MSNLLARLFLLALNGCYALVHNYALAIVLFTALTKVLLQPIALWTHKNSLKMVALMPETNRLKIEHYGDKDTIAEETQRLYKREHYHSLLSLLPLIVQLILLAGMVDAIHAITDTGVSLALGLIPSQTGGWTLLAPVAAALASLVLGLAQNRINPLQREQSPAEQWMTNGLSVLLSLVLGFFVPVGVILYWISSTLLGIPVQLVCNAMMPPKKYVDYPALYASKAELEKMSSLSGKRSKEERRREKADYKRFFSVANKHLVFYSEKSGFYKYYKAIIEYLLAHSNVIIHYVTNDPNDQIFALARQQERIRPYYIGQNKTITLFMKMDADIVVMTTPGLNDFYLKRSYVRKDIEYIYLEHAIGSSNFTTLKGSYDHFDTILCCGPFYAAEIRETEEMYNTPEKTLVPYGYGLLDELIDHVAQLPAHSGEKPRILIAPSWQKDNILDLCIDPLLERLLTPDYRVTVRPHPEYVKRYGGRMNALLEKYRDRLGPDFQVELDFSSNESIYTADLLITDWSGIAYEYAFSTLRPCLFIDTPIKAYNPDYTKYKNQPQDILWRNLVGVSLPPDKLETVDQSVAQLLQSAQEYQDKIQALRAENIYNLGQAGRAGGQYILQQLKKRKRSQ